MRNDMGGEMGKREEPPSEHKSFLTLAPLFFGVKLLTGERKRFSWRFQKMPSAPPAKSH